MHKEKVSLSKYTVIEEARVRETFNWLQHYSIDSLKNEFKSQSLDLQIDTLSKSVRS